MAAPTGSPRLLKASLWSLATPLLVTAVLVPFVSSSAAANDKDIFGTWLREDGNARVRVAACGPMICATNIWIRDPAGQKENVGDRLEFRIKRSGGSWNGDAYDPQRKLNFSAMLTASGDLMTSKGCKFGVICRTTSWTRVSAQ